MVPQNGQLAAIDLLRSTLSGMVNTQKAFNIAAACCRSGWVCHDMRVLFRSPKMNDMIASATISTLNNMFHPAIDSPNRDHGTSSHRITGVASRLSTRSAVDPPDDNAAVHPAGPAHNCHSTPA
jgi:hypothetical protein